MPIRTPLFRLQFSPLEIKTLATRYYDKREADALVAGELIRKGQYTFKNLAIICEWKTRGRRRTLLAENKEEEVADTLRLALDAKSDRAAIAVLTGLSGVQVPVASAIVTAIYPERFTIVDFRALQALGVTNAVITVDFYLKYLEACSKLAKESRVDLRMLDRALWQWSKEKSLLRQRNHAGAFNG